MNTNYNLDKIKQHKKNKDKKLILLMNYRAKIALFKFVTHLLECI